MRSWSNHLHEEEPNRVVLKGKTRIWGERTDPEASGYRGSRRISAWQGGMIFDALTGYRSLLPIFWIEIYSILKGENMFEFQIKVMCKKKLQLVLGINSKNVATSTMSLVCRDGERHLEGHICINTWRAESGDDISFARDWDPSQRVIYTSVCSVWISVPGCQLGTALPFFNKHHQSSNTRGFETLVKDHIVFILL